MQDLDLYAAAITLLDGGNAEAALPLLRKAVNAKPQQARIQHALGRALGQLGRTEEAALHLREAVAGYQRELPTKRRPQDAPTLCELADILQDNGQYANAVKLYRESIELQPAQTRAWYSMGCAEIARAEYVPAIECFKAALQRRPDWLAARHNLGRALFEIGQASAAFVEFGRCNAPESRGMAAMIAPGVPEADQQTVLKVRRNWAGPALPRPKFPPMHRPLRIGYLSAFFHRENWMKPVWALIQRHDVKRFDVHLFSDSLGYGTDVSQLSNEELAALIRSQRIDVLVDLNGYSCMRRLPLFRLRPAPVIVGWFNMYATTGIPEFDYLIGDSEVIRPEEEPFYSEKILRVSGSYLTFDVTYPVPEVAEPADPSAPMRFGSFGSQYKITGEVIRSWSEILSAVPKSTMRIKNRHLASPTARAFVEAQFRANGIASERLLLEGPEEHFAFLEAYGRVDLALDTFPYNGGTTTTEAIWQGVPVLTFSGDRWASRTSASILRAAGLGEFVADDLETFIHQGARWGSERQLRIRLGDLRRGMRAMLKQSAVCNTERFTREMEALYLQVAV